MTYFVYILENKAGTHYTGYTADLERRIKDHNSGKSKWTKKRGPWRLVHKEVYSTKEGAYLRERQIKRLKAGRAFRKLLENANCN